jgi:hypothetical protein
MHLLGFGPRLPSMPAASCYLTRVIPVFLASRVRWWNQRERAWWRRRQFSQWVACPGGRDGRLRPASRRAISGMVSGISPGSGGGGWSGPAGGGAWVSVRSRSMAAVTAQIARAAITRGVIDPEVLWACTNCGACVNECPVDIEHIDRLGNEFAFSMLA